MSAVTERDRVYMALADDDDADDDKSIPVSAAGPATTADTGVLSSSRLSQTVGQLSLQVAARLRDEAHLREAYDTYRYALGIFADQPPETDDDGSGRRTYCKLVSGLLRGMGVVKCQLGEMAAGCQLLHESAALYQWMIGRDQLEPSVQDVITIADVWYQLGCNFLSDDMRQETLLDHVMRLTKTELSAGGEKPKYDDDDDDDDDEASFDVRTQDVGAGILDVEETEGEYSVCTREAVICYQKALNMLDRSPQTGRLRDPNIPADLAELYAAIYCRLADCYVLTAELDRAVVTYERALPYFRLAVSGGGVTADGRRSLLALNAHALSMLATVNFLLRSFWRASVLYETATLLLHQLHQAGDDAADTGLESAWIKTMHGLTFATLGRDHQCAVWSLRAFADYVKVLRWRILGVEPLRRWFVVETLYALGKAYTALEDGALRAVHYLSVARNLACAAPHHQTDFPQTIEVLDSLADACQSVSQLDAAQRHRDEADRLAATFYGPSATPKPRQDPATSPCTDPDPAPRRSAAGLGGVADTASIRDGVVTLISRLGLVMVDADVDDSLCIHQAERQLRETVSRTADADVIALSSSASSNTADNSLLH